MARRLNNWLQTFGEWTLPRSESPENFIMWSGLFTLSSALRRRVCIPKEYMGSYSIYPNLYVMFIAPQGKVRKTTTINYTISLLSQIEDVTSSPTALSKEAMLSQLINSHDASVYITSEEFSDILHKSGDTMYEFLVSLYDCKSEYKASTISRGHEVVLNPCMNMIAATTPIWLSENMREDVIGGGFSSRVVYIYEDTPRQRILFYKNKVDFDKIAALEIDLVNDLEHISKLEGEFKLEDEVLEYLEEWYKGRTDEVNRHLQGYHERKPIHILKTAMLCSVARDDKLLITKQDVLLAKHLLENTEANLPRVFERMGKNVYAFDMISIVDYISSIGRVTKPDLLAHFSNVARPSELEELIDGLQNQKAIYCKFDEDEKVSYFYAGSE